jgi:malate dehydrogenase
MKLNPLVTDLSLYDIAGTPGVAADISHVDTGARVSNLSCSLAPGFSFSLSDSFFEPDLWYLV